ncbi:PAS domain S-box protein [Horticoccus sp. 23ND18S-11]|uniref:PAS domain S-box protein n=1 Tax=Horticoccus sp. 23ND18S-11 TaxID=3391832 RepID=UPI0039C99BA3
MHLLHLEDSPTDAELIAILIRREWPACEIKHVATAAEYRAALECGGFDLILSDYSLPGFDGLSALSMARARFPETPFVFLSGTIGEERAVEALKRGATDYVIKDRTSRLIPAIRQAFALLVEADRRRRTEAALRENEERFRQITENVVELIALLDLNACRIYANPAYRDLLGEAAVLPGADAFSEVYPEDRARVAAMFTQVIATGATQRCEYRLLLPDGGVRQIESHASVLRDAAARIVNVLLVSRDVTSRREAEARLREQASLLDRARDAIIATDLEHRIAYWNASAERLYGWKAAEVYGLRLDTLELGYDPARFAMARAQLFASGEWRGDFRLRTKAGEVVLVESTWSLVVENDGLPRSILYIDTDVTERKRLETQLLRAQRMESIGTLAGGVAHDLNNVLTPILLSIELLAAKATCEEDRKLIEKTRASATHGAALVQQLLAFARGADAKRTRIDPGTALADLRPLIRQSLPQSIDFSLRGAERAWPIQADTTQFNQVLINLCINARDAMPQGGRIEVELENIMVDAALAAANPGAHPGPHLRISVNDSGTGIAPGIIDKIFDPFFTTKAAGKGTGLGLSMVAGILKSHGGFVHVDSEPGRGSTFHLFFPATPESGAEHTPIASGPARGQGEGILLIDDEPIVRDTLQLLLQRAGYHVFPAADGSTGLLEYERHRTEISLAITDMMLPDQVGTGVISALRQRTATLPIIAISGMMGSGRFDPMLRSQSGVECLAKPLSPASLLAAVRRGLQTSEPNHTSAPPRVAVGAPLDGVRLKS